jgi:heme/copper-type cytochrome/quinol oxidase subunit 2
MIEKNSKNNASHDYDYIDIRELLLSVLDRKLLFLSITTSFAFFSVIYSLSLTNIYTSEAILMPSEDVGASRSSGRYAEIASMAGLSATVSSVSKTDKGIKELESYIFFKKIIESKDILPELFASKTFDKKNKILEYDQEIYNKKEKNINYLQEVDNQLVVPINKKIRFLLTSNDVLHAWWVPDLALKKDAIPGFINEMSVVINEPGIYRGRCAELCGRHHGFMPIVIKAVAEDEYDEWLANAGKDNASGLAKINK